MNTSEIIKHLKSIANPKNIEGMARFGINPVNTLGVSVVQLRQIAKKIGKNHQLALELWESGIHEARVLASIIDDHKQLTEMQMDAWVKEFDSWDVCDQCCINLFRKAPIAHDKTVEWSARNETFVKRAGFALIATLAVHDKKAGDSVFINYLSIVKKESIDDRNFVKKAVNWALRQIGKRNRALNQQAIAAAKEILKLDSKSARWIAADAIKELASEKVLERLS
jgi:3-methyladenine DNA glycosylase AlkD